jgi:hypothetical protein
MNQIDWEKMRENFAITEVSRAKASPWFSVLSEYHVNVGGKTSGNYLDTQTINDVYERFVEAPASFEYDYKFKTSTQRVSTTSGTPVDDSEALLTITLPKESYALIIYNAGNNHGSQEDHRGKGCAINIDNVDVAFSWQSPSTSNYANSVTVIWAGWLTAGSHDIKGRFFANNDGSLVGIDTRQLVVFWFSGVIAEYKRSTVKATTNSNLPVDDPEATVNLTLQEYHICLIIYNVANQRGSLESIRGKGVTLNIDGSDISTKEWQSPQSPNNANSVTIIYATLLDSGEHVIKGRFFSNRNGQTVTIDERQIAVICFPTNAVKYAFKESSIPISTTSNTPVNDAEAHLSMELTDNSDCLILYAAGNVHGVSENMQGKGLLLNMGGVDKTNSSCQQSPYSNNYADSVISLWCEQQSAGTFIVQGKFFSNNPGSSVTISNRQLLILAFSRTEENVYRLDLNGEFQANLSVYPSAFIKSVEILLRYRANSTEEKFYVKAYNWTAAIFMDDGFNSTNGHTPSMEWSYYALNLTDKWQDYVDDNGMIRLKIQDEMFDPNPTAIDIDFLAIRVVVDATKFEFKNNGGSTLHIVSLWVINATVHQRFTVNYFVNAGENATYLRFDIVLPKDKCVIKAVTERGNTVTYTVDASDV